MNTKKWPLIVALILVMLLTLKHSYSVYAQVAGTEIFGYSNSFFSMIYIIGMMLAFDVAILMLAIRGNTWGSGVFAFLTFAINAYYFAGFIEGGLSWAAWYKTIPGLSWSGMLAFGIYYFSHEFANLLVDDDHFSRMEQEKISLEDRVVDLQNENGQLKKDLLTQTEILGHLSDLKKSKNSGQIPTGKTGRNSGWRKTEFAKSVRSKSVKKIRDMRDYRTGRLSDRNLDPSKAERYRKEVKIIEEILQSQPA